MQPSRSEIESAGPFVRGALVGVLAGPAARRETTWAAPPGSGLRAFSRRPGSSRAERESSCE